VKLDEMAREWLKLWGPGGAANEARLAALLDKAVKQALSLKHPDGCPCDACAAGAEPIVSTYEEGRAMTLAELRRLAEEVRKEYDPPRPAWSWYDIGRRDACDEILRRLFPTKGKGE
jgi:hypothetical protein